MMVDESPHPAAPEKKKKLYQKAGATLQAF